MFFYIELFRLKNYKNGFVQKNFTNCFINNIYTPKKSRITQFFCKLDSVNKE